MLPTAINRFFCRPLSIHAPHDSIDRDTEIHSNVVFRNKARFLRVRGSTERPHEESDRTERCWRVSGFMACVD